MIKEKKFVVGWFLQLEWNEKNEKKQMRLLFGHWILWQIIMIEENYSVDNFIR